MYYTLYQVTESWGETSVNWNNRPAKEGGYTDYIQTDAAIGWWEYDITGPVTDWVDGTAENYGLAITSPAGCTLPTVYSSDNSDAAHRPKITIEYTVNSAVEEATWGQIKADL